MKKLIQKTLALALIAFVIGGTKPCCENYMVEGHACAPICCENHDYVNNLCSRPAISTFEILPVRDNG